MPDGCPAIVKRGPRKGQQCGRAPQVGLDTCLAHASKEERESRRFGGSQPNAGRPKLERPIEAAQRLVEEHIVAVLRPYFMTLGYDVELVDGRAELRQGDMPKLTATFKGETYTSDIVDLGAMMDAANALLDRVYGRPRQALEHTGADGERLTFADLATIAAAGGREAA